jgi:hypothetical protein
MPYPVLVDRQGLQLWRVAVNALNEQWHKPKGGYFSAMDSLNKVFGFENKAKNVIYEALNR